ncbi:hypothetical protein HYE68_006873 [Fusarium pseudograminearum]|nr:hypothetical protein HYE68_006873 [Fusarium pseudograminearum]
MSETTKPELRNLMASENVSDVHSDRLGESLQQSSPSWFRRVGVSIPLLVIPIVYAILLAAMVYLHGKTQSSFGDAVLEILSVASTLWPILFAAVLGPVLKTVALFQAERGSTLGSLEFLLTSQTTASALKNFVTMGWIGSWAIVVLTAWSLSPLGGQAALRSLHRHQNPVSMQKPAAYYLGNNRSDIYQHYFDGTGGVNSASSPSLSLIYDMTTVLSASFSTQDTLVSHANSSSPNYHDAIVGLGGKLEASRSGRRDLWRNIRIPFIELLPEYRSDDPHAWIPVPDDEIVPYASLIGLPIRNGSSEGPGNSTMKVHSRYMTLSCGKAFNGTEMVSNGSRALWLHDTSSKYALTGQFIDQASTNGLRNIWLDFPNNSVTAEHLDGPLPFAPRSKLQLIMGGSCWYQITAQESQRTPMIQACDISTSYIDMEVTCNRPAVDAGLVCQADRVRHAPSYPIKGNLTAFSNGESPKQILIELTYMGASQDPEESTVLETYLRDPPGLFRRSPGVYTNSDYRTTTDLGCFTAVPTEILERRLATALNTIIMSSYPLDVLVGGKGLVFEHWQNTTALWKEFKRDIYVLSKPWFAMTMLSTVVLMICAIANIIIRQRIKAPDILDSITGLTRDSQFIDLPQIGSGRSGSDQLATIKNVKVRIGDIYPEREVGRIALTTELNSPELRWNRSYS